MFFTKRLCAHKNIHKKTLTNKTELRKQKTAKETVFCVHKLGG